MKIYAFALGLLALAIPALADTIDLKSFSAEFSNPITGGTESFQTEFEWDRTLQDIVPGSMEVSSAGALGAFNFTEFSVEHTHVVNQVGAFNDTYLYSFFWADQSGDIIDSAVANDFGPEVFPHWIPLFSFTGPDVAAGWSAEDHPGLIGFFADSFPATPTPEPSSLLLCGIGLISCVFMLRRKLIS
jgi:PEP-CTERM motif